MQILSEKEIEDILVLHPELIEAGLTLIDRQAQLESRRTDLTFRDRSGGVLLVELKKDEVTEEHVEQLADYMVRFQRTGVKNARGMIIGQTVRPQMRSMCNELNLEYLELPVREIFDYLQTRDTALYHDMFIKGKLHARAKKVDKLQFQEYLEATSPFGVPYTTYQHALALDASNELSSDSRANQTVADEFMARIIDMNFERSLFRGQATLYRDTTVPAQRVSLAPDGSWRGVNLAYQLRSSDHPDGLPCELYLGSIGYRGNKPTFADERSRFLVIRIGRQGKEGSTQYGFHKYLQTEKRRLFPFYELKFNAQSLPKTKWPAIYDTFEKFGYHLYETGKKSSLKHFYIGEIALDGPISSEQIGNLIEALFVVAVVKQHFKEKGPRFHFLESN